MTVWDGTIVRLLNSNPLGFPASERESSASYEDHEGVPKRNRLNYSHFLTWREAQVQKPATLLIGPLQPHNSLSLIVSRVRQSHSATISLPQRLIILNFIFNLQLAL